MPTSRLLLAARVLILVDAAVVLVGTGSLTLHVGNHPPTDLWTVLSAAALVIAGLVLLTRLLPVAWPARRTSSKR